MQEEFSFASSLTKGREEQTPICQTAFSMGRCYMSSPTWLSEHTTSLAGTAPAHLALGLTGAEVARAVKLRNDGMMQQNAPHEMYSDSAKRCTRSTVLKPGGVQGFFRGKHVPSSPEVCGVKMPDLPVLGQA